MGHDTNTAHFSIMMGPAPHLNGDYTIFGQFCSPYLRFLFPAALLAGQLACLRPVTEAAPALAAAPHTAPPAPAPCPLHTAGQVVSGLDVVDAINALSRGKPDNTAGPDAGAQIVDSGQLRKGTLAPDLRLGLT